MLSRLQRIQNRLVEFSVDGLLVFNPENRQYLSGFTGSAGVLVITPSEAALITDFRYWEQAAKEASTFKLLKQGPNLWQNIREAVLGFNLTKVGFEAGTVTYLDYQHLAKFLNEVELCPLNEVVETERRVKDETEIEVIAEAARITDLAWEKTIAKIKPGVKERDLALEFDYQLRLHGAEGSAFPTIVASGWRAALPHGIASEKEVLPGDLVLIDGGALYQGYHADMTRTVILGQAQSEQTKIYQVVLEAQLKALDKLQEGLPGSAVDAVAREYIAEAGYGAYFGHGLGHSVGLNIHENPRLSTTEKNIIPKGAVITVEPGIYLPGVGGVRIEDLVVVEADGVRNLTGSPKQELIEL